MTERLDAAISYAERGWPVFKLNGKVPPAGSRSFKEATTDERKIKAWWRKGAANIGLATGEAGLLVVDIDPQHGGEGSLRRLEREHGPLPKTVRARTGGGGEHIYFENPGDVGSSAGRIGRGIDVRGEGGYVVLPPSTHKSGNRYEWIESPEEVEIAEAPDWLIELCDRTEDKATDWEPSGRKPSRKVLALLDDGDWPMGEQREIAERCTRALLNEGRSTDEVVERVFDALERSDQDGDNPWLREDIEKLTVDFERNPPPRKREDSKKRDEVLSRLTPIDLSESWDEVTEAEWVIPGLFLKGKYHEFVGAMGTGKSLALLGMIVTEAFPRGIRTAYLDEENGADEIKRRLRALGADPEDVSRYFLYLPDVMPTVKEADEIVPFIASLDVRLVVFDSLADFYVAAGLDEDNNRDATEWAKAYPEALAHDHGIATVGIDHVGHADQTRARGASAKGAKADATWTIEVEKEFDINTVGKLRLNRGRKNRQGVLPESHLFKLGGDGEGHIEFSRLKDHAAEEEKRREVEEAKEFKRTVLEILDEAGPDGLAQSKLVKAMRESGLQFNQNAIKAKLQEYAENPAVAITFTQSGEKRIYRSTTKRKRARL